MSDQQITCGDCGEVFVFTAAEQSFYEEKGLAVPPKRCRACRQARKAGRSDGRGANGGHVGGNGRRYSGDVNEYRSPMTGGVDDWGAARRSFGGGNGHNGGHNGGHHQGGARPPRRDGGGWGAGEYRSPAFPDSRDDWRARGPKTQDRRFGPGGGHGAGGQNGGGRGPQRANGDFGRPRSEHNAPSRPRFDITCGQCGAQAQVPFKPLEGRQVFCQDCYRARRASAREGVERMDVRDTDTGIVE